MLDQTAKHEKVLYPVTRVKVQGAGGSGVLVYSEPDSKNSDEYINIVLTCEHVIDEAIENKDDWDPVLQKNKKVDFMSEVSVEIFDYDGSNVVSANSSKGNIIAYDKHHDIAAIRLKNNRQLPNVATIFPEKDIPLLKLFDPVWVSGCSLLHDPFASKGEITYLREIIDQKTYIMQNAPAVFGNSGGGLFHGKDGHLLGLVSRVTAIQLGFGVDVMTWMNFSTHPERLYEFFKYQELQFLVDPNDDYYSAMERREKRKKAALRDLLMGSQKSKDDIGSE
jgi:hypothetical protein